MGYSYFIHTLEPAKNYSVSVFSEITNFTGTFDRSEADMRLFRTPTSSKCLIDLIQLNFGIC